MNFDDNSSSGDQISRKGLVSNQQTDAKTVHCSTCPLCRKTFSRRGCLNRHMKIHNGVKPFACPTCERSFTRKSDMKKHIERFHQSKQVGVGSTNVPTPTSAAASRRLPVNIGGFILVESVAQNRLLTYRISPEGETASCLSTFFNSIKDSAVEILKQNLQGWPTIKTNIFMEAAFKKPKAENPDEYDYCTRNLKTKNKSIYRATDLAEFVDTMCRKLETEKTECEMKGSGWIFSHVQWLELRVNKFRAL